tara:strand:- start:32 stop:385 length:354 start_codon:yes stop_codon:yes gene_type:complete
MKNLIIALFITLSSLSLKAQEEFNGMWKSEATSYVTTILASEWAVVGVSNTCFTKLKVLDEKILKYKNKKLTTSIHNKENGYTAEVRYEWLDSNTLSSTYSTFPGKVYMLKRIQTNK